MRRAFSMSGRFSACLSSLLLAVVCGAPSLCMAQSAPAAPAPTLSIAALEKQVADTERAFARTMQLRDHAQFTSFLAEDAIFFDGETPQRGKRAVAESWKGLYSGPQAPFSWEPDHVEVLAGGALAHSSGPVTDAKGKVIARFNSVWRLEAPGVWRIVFDKGSPVCDCAKAK